MEISWKFDKKKSSEIIVGLLTYLNVKKMFESLASLKLSCKRKKQI